MIDKQGKGSATPTHKLRAGYVRSKDRLCHALQEAKHVSYGIREEHRISLSLLDRLRSSLQASGDWDATPPLLDPNSELFWRLTSVDYIQYLFHNTNKYTAVIEWIWTLEVDGWISYERCKVLVMLLQALPFAFDSRSLRRQIKLWKTTLQRRE